MFARPEQNCSSTFEKSNHLPHASAQSTVCSRNEFFVMILNDSRNLYEYPKVRSI